MLSQDASAVALHSDGGCIEANVSLHIRLLLIIRSLHQLLMDIEHHRWRVGLGCAQEHADAGDEHIAQLLLVLRQELPGGSSNWST